MPLLTSWLVDGCIQAPSTTLFFTPQNGGSLRQTPKIGKKKLIKKPDVSKGFFIKFFFQFLAFNSLANFSNF